MTAGSTPQAETERYAHLVLDLNALDVAMREGTPVTSTCGKVWVPARDPRAYSLCPTCVETIRLGWAA